MIFNFYTQAVQFYDALLIYNYGKALLDYVSSAIIMLLKISSLMATKNY